VTARESDLIARAARGDRRAFDALVAPRWNRIFRIALRMLNDREESQDVAQKSCLKLWQTLDRFRLGEDIDAWIYRIVVNHCLDALRRHRVRRESPLPEHPGGFEATDGAPGPERRVLARELERILQEITQDLPPRQKAIFVLTRLEGMTAVQAADVLGVAASTARNHLFQVRTTISRRIRERYPELLVGAESSAGKTGGRE